MGDGDHTRWEFVRSLVAPQGRSGVALFSSPHNLTTRTHLGALTPGSLLPPTVPESTDQPPHHQVLSVTPSIQSVAHRAAAWALHGGEGRLSTPSPNAHFNKTPGGPSVPRGSIVCFFLLLKEKKNSRDPNFFSATEKIKLEAESCKKLPFCLCLSR